jgi:tetratricopeptide (TPR) repeat protein
MDHDLVEMDLNKEGEPAANRAELPGSLWSNHRFVILTVGLSIALSCIHLASIKQSPMFNFPFMDSSDYIQDAQVTLGQVPAVTPYYHSPFYGWFLATIFKLFGDQLLMVRLAQILVNGLSCILIYLLGCRLFTKKEARVAAFIWAFYGPLIFYSSEVLNVTVVLFSYLLTFYLVIRAFDEPSTTRWALAGIITGLAALTRPDILPFAAIVILALVIKVRHQEKALKPAFLKRALLSVAIFALSLSLPLLLVGARNSKVSGEFAPLPANGGLNFYQGNNPNYKETIGIRLSAWHTLVDMPLTDGTAAEINTKSHGAYYYRKAYEFIANNPLGYLQNLTYKVRTLANGYELPETFDMYWYRKYSPVLSVLVWQIGYFSFPFGALLPLALVGGYLTRRRWREIWLLPAFGASLLISLIVYWNSSRYRLSLLPVLILFASASLVWAWEELKKKHRRQVLVVAGAVVLLAILTNWRYDHFSHTYNFEAEAYALAGTTATTKGHVDEGLSFFNRALDLESSNGYYHYLNAKGLMKASQTEAAVAHFREAVKFNPQYYLGYLELGLLLAENRRFDEAYQAFSEALEINPRLCTAYFYIAEIHLEKGESDKALDNLIKTLEINPLMYEAHNELGIVWTRKGDLQKAIEAFSQALQINPNFQVAKDNFYGASARQNRLNAK